MALAKPLLKDHPFLSENVTLFADHAVGSLGRAVLQQREGGRRDTGGKTLFMVAAPGAHSPLQ